EQQSRGWLAARHRAARAYLPDRRSPDPRGPEPAAGGPAALDPLGAESPAQLSALLSELRQRSGPSYREMQRVAKEAGCGVDWTRLWAVGARSAFPSPRVLEAFLTGCGVPPAEREPWRLARKRLTPHRGTAANTVGEELDLIRRRSLDPPPDPRTADTWAKFAEALHALVTWSGLSLTELAGAAIDAGVPVTVDALRHALVHRDLPTPSTLHAFTAGCGLSDADRHLWYMARTRLASAPPQARRLPPFRWRG
ncbi:MAG TPA: helix-turn-helix transcriptional regulator, partial [Actinospica sp.]|nr:helix-turn-helix transcriptional regulator [Actinospica sp.]